MAMVFNWHDYTKFENGHVFFKRGLNLQEQTSWSSIVVVVLILYQ